MRKLIVIWSIILTITMVASGYAAQFLTTVLAMSLNLPGPLSESPIAWLWFAVSVALLLTISFAFCWAFARQLEKRLGMGKSFE